VTNADFTRSLGRALGRWTILPMPAWQVRLLFGGVSVALLGSQRCRPARTLAGGFVFRYPDLEPALQQILEPSPGA
jgi:NAD dependent epimerase/dehydratase family enzyme